MNRSTSAYLDLIRFAAAAVVFLGHAGTDLISGGLFWQFKLVSQEAVVVFFVLSGFVIAYTNVSRERTPSAYATNRLARVYSVAIPALMLTFAADAIGRAFRPELYSAIADYSSDDRAWQALNGFLFTNQLWSTDVRIGINGPYWSMGFEVWYYVAFGLAAFAPRRWALAAAAAALVVAGPKIAILFPIWLMGFAGYRLCVWRPLGARIGLLAWAGSTALLVAYECLSRVHGPLFAAFSVTPQRVADYGHYYLVGALFAASLIGFHGASVLAAPPKWAANAIRWLGERTFSLYLFHMPLLFLTVAIAPWPATSWASRCIIFLGVPVVIVLLAEVTERRKRQWRLAIGGIGHRLGRLYTLALGRA